VIGFWAFQWQAGALPAVGQVVVRGVDMDR